MSDSAEIIDLFGVRFTGQRGLDGRIYVPASAESRAGLSALKKIGGEMNRIDDSKILNATSCQSPRDVVE